MFSYIEHFAAWFVGLLGLVVRYLAATTTTTIATAPEAKFAADINAPNPFKDRCNAFQPETHIPHSTLNAVQYIPAGTNLSLQTTDPSCKRSYQLVAVDLCRIELSVPTSSKSSVDMEVWMPRNWTGRFLGTGNGGLGGCIQYEDLAYGSRYGFASVGSNNGHDGNTAAPFYENPEVAIDYAWRALHTSVVVGKKLVRQFYGRPHSKSYYIGCSSGGRQGINAADKFPDDFDGIVAGAPAIDFNNLVSWRAHFFPITGTVDSAHFISEDTWVSVIHEEVQRQCDALDGVRDRILEDPSLCKFRPETLRCGADIENNCLTEAQVEAVQKIYSPLTRENGEIIYPAMQPGNEVSAFGQFYAGKPFRYSEEWFKYVIYDPSWDALTFNVHDATTAESLNPGSVKTWPNSLAKFREKNGKLFMYHGGQDNKITPFNSERFYRYFARETDMRPGELDEFFRFFRISGMSHCHTGPGAWMFGQDGVSIDGLPFTRQRNALAAVVDWVEEGIGPEIIEGTKFVNDTADAGVSLRRKHCRYPFRNTYTGADSKAPEGWQCLWIDDWELSNTT